jgi:hypothetical protein
MALSNRSTKPSSIAGALGLGTSFLQNLINKAKQGSKNSLNAANAPDQSLSVQDAAANYFKSPNLQGKPPRLQQDYEYLLDNQGTPIGADDTVIQDEEGYVQDIIKKDGTRVHPEQAAYGFNADEILNKYQETLDQAGYKTDSENLKRFVEGNPDISNPKLDFTGLKSKKDPVEVKSIGQSIRDTVTSMPIFSVMKGLVKPVETVMEGLSRYEAAKTEFLQNMSVAGPLQAGKPVGDALAGKARSDVPGREDKYPELGDLFRKMGLPEGVASSLGLATDVLTDLPIFGGASTLAKEGGAKLGSLYAKGIVRDSILNKPASKAASVIEDVLTKLGKNSDEITEFMQSIAGKTSSLDKPLADLSTTLNKASDAAGIGAKEGLTNIVDKISALIPEGVVESSKTLAKNTHEAFLKFRGNEFVKMAEEAIVGKGKYDDLEPSLKQALRSTRGEAEAASFDAGILAGQFKRVAGEAPEKLNLLDQALKGDLDSLGKLTPDERALIAQSRQMIDEGSKSIADELQHIIDNDPDRIYKIADRMGLTDGGQKVPVPALMETIKDNMGSYVKRMHRIFVDPEYKPDPDTIKKAVQGFLDDGVAKNQEQAELMVKDILEKKRFSFTGKSTLRVDEGSFRRRQDIPPYLRELLGEIKDPRYNVIQTVRSQAEARAHFKIFREMKDAGLFSAERSKIFSEPVPSGGPLAWGVIDGLHTTPEIANLLKTQKLYMDSLDSVVLKMMRFFKGFKTVGNVKAHGHNMFGNAGYFSVLAGVNPLSHPSRFKQAGEVYSLVKKVNAGKLTEEAAGPLFKAYKEMIKDGLIGTELPVADQLSYLDDLIKNPFAPRSKNIVSQGFDKIAKGMAEAYSWEDQIFKIATYLEYTGKRGMESKQAVDEIFKWYPNYTEASRLAEYARSTPAGVLFMNPFTTFRTESHRILLNAMKDSPRSRLISSLFFSSRMALNTAILAYMGNSTKDIWETFLTRPELISEVALNPTDPSGNFDLNMQYMDPFNTKGLFAPVMFLAGATNVNPFDYILDFTTFSPEFGYSNILTSSIEPAIAGRDKFGNQLNYSERAKAALQGFLPSSFARDLPKIVDSKESEEERIRRTFKFVGIDLEQRNPDYIRGEIKKRLEDKVRNGEDITSLLKAIDTLGFDGKRMLQNIENKKKEIKSKKEKPKKSSNEQAVDRALKFLGM